MKRLSIAALLLIPVALWSKGPTVKIEFAGGDLSAPYTSTDTVVREFNVWGGLGTFGGNAKPTGFILAATTPVSEPRPELPRYEVTFFEEKDAASGRSEPVYIVRWVWDKAERKGAVYLPLPRVDGKRFEINTHSIYRGIEGSWFRTSDKWNHFVLKTLALAKSPYVVEKPVQ